MQTSLAKKVVLVTGGAGGIGSDIVRLFRAEGARVVIHFNSSKKAADALVSECGSNDTIAIGADLTNELEVAALFRNAEKMFGPIDVVVANAGYWPPQDIPIQKMELSHFKSTIDSNLTSVFLTVREFFRQIERTKIPAPSVVLVGSTAGVFGEAGHVDYAAAKAAIGQGMLLTLKNEIVQIAPQGRVNAVSPGWTVSPMVDVSSQKEHIQKALQTVPLRKIGKTTDVAKTVVYLSSSELAGHITGQNVMLAGGMEGRVQFAVPDR